MNGTVKKVFDEVAAQTGLRLDEVTGSLIGVYGGYHITAVYTGQFYTINASVRKNGQLPDKELLKTIKASTPGVKALGVQKNNVVANVHAMTTGKLIEKMVSAIKGLTEEFRINGFEDVCEGCGMPHSDISTYFVGGKVTFLCDECYQSISQNLQQNEIQMDNTEENVVGGIVGAFLGSLIGVACIILIGQLGYIASISGVVMGVCTVKGYEKLAKKFSTKGTIISIIMMIVMTYFAVKVDWCLDGGVDVFVDLFKYFWDFLRGYDLIGTFFADLGMVYLFTLVGGIPTIINTLKNKAVAYNSYKIQ